MTNPSLTAPRRHPGRLFLALGLGVAILGVAAYVAQLSAHRLSAPWYLPLSGMLAAAFLVVALRQARTLWRVLALLLVILLAGAEWTFLLGARLPPYAGPVAIGTPFPAFATVRADGTPFTHCDLMGDHDIILVFFRGRW